MVDLATLRDGSRASWPPLLVWSCLLALPVGRVVEAPVLAMALAGLWLIATRWRDVVGDPRVRFFGGVFLSGWVPVLLSLPDAVEPERTAVIALNHLRFFLGGIFVIYALSDLDAHRSFLRLCAWLLLFWVVDGVVQAIFGRDLFGYSLVANRINALFGENSLKYTVTLALFCPLLFEHARRRWPTWAAALVATCALVVVLLAGSRSAWISMAVVVAVYLGLRWYQLGRCPWRLIAGAALIGPLIVGALYHGSAWFATRVDASVEALQGHGADLGNSVEHRLWIWRGAGNMIRANPLNGVGARGFRYAFSEYAAEGDPYIAYDPPHVPSHSHQLWIEILAETGLIGASGLLLIHVLLARAWWRAGRESRLALLPYALCLVVAYFPLNTHQAFYSAFWSQLVWWLTALFCAAPGADRGASERALRRSPDRALASRVHGSSGSGGR